MNDKLVAVATHLDPVEANLLKIHLEESGIDAYLSGEDAVGVFPPLAVSTPGVQVLVRDVDVARANELLEEHRKSK